MRRSSSYALVLFLAATAAAPGVAQAQDNSASIEALFAEGKKLVKEGKYAEACPKFLASYNLENRSGTLLNLADCYERAGMLASAWARWVEAKAIAGRANQADRVQLATLRAAALEPKLSKLTITVANAPPDLVVTRDGVTVAAAVYGEAVPVDSGKHTISATAPNRAPWTTDVNVGSSADQQTVVVPALVEQAAPPPALPTPEPPPPETHKTGTRTIVGLATAGAGVVAVGIGSYFGFAAIGLKNKSDANGLCSATTNDCTQQAGVNDRSSAVSDATISTVLVAVGGAALVGGVVLWLTDPSSRSRTTVGFDGRMVRLAGSF